ncbi:MAG: hypothetical protein ACRC33_23610 [Gemmataceae bacterium]
MDAADLLGLLRREPFQPLRLFAADGRTYDIRHPDQGLVLRTRVVLGIPAADGVPDGTEHLALDHIVRVGEFPAAPGNGAE